MLKKLLRCVLVVIRLLIHFLCSFSNEKVLHSQSSRYNQRILICSSRSKIRMRFNDMSSGIQSEIDLNRMNSPIVNYIQLMLVSLVYFPLDFNSKEILIIGLGGGVLPRTLRSLFPNCSITIVEIDQIVCELAKKYFFFQEDSQMQVNICDGRTYLTQLSEQIQFDVIFVDAYDSNNSLPFHMKTEEFFVLLRNHLKSEGGFIIWNLVSIYQSFVNISQTIRSVFNSNHLIEFRTRNHLNRIVVVSTFTNVDFKQRNEEFLRLFEDKLSIDPLNLLKSEDKQMKSACMNSTIDIYTDQSNDIFYEENLSLGQFLNLN